MTDSFAFNRRECMLRILQLGAAAAVVPGLRGAPAWTPQILTPAQNEALVTLGDRIVPGSAAALCNQLIDLVLTMESEQTRAQLTGALAAFDRDPDGSRLTAASVAGGPAHEQFLIVKEWVADAYWSSEPGLRELGSIGKMSWPAFPGCETGPRP